MTTYKLLALDMDGTVLNEQQEISEENAYWIAEAKKAGITVCFSTGRAFQSAMPYAEQLGLQSPMITVNGSEVWRAPYDLYRRHMMDASVVRELYELANQYDVWFWGYTIDQTYLKSTWNASIAFEQEKWLKFGYTVEDEAIRHEIETKLNRMGGFEITNSSPINIEVNPLGISKASGLKDVCEILGIGMHEVVAVGDSINDLAAIQTVGLGVAMGNAQEIVKESADLIVGSNEEHGVAQVIRDYLLK
ncbi:phosphoglycolate phosphatase [Paenibacillus selenitireducens]|uniref:Phosphoglycolate phosphatase n=1 Tax=Paenibacillus selenitireducens TaxID=1324314 RepID=A0A1T2XJL9_9BACL|nr:Cof-type HAD-IIB family hydrolase [Paenibacillus selenitireducens]OPA80008.1 phosphoglycolate phosphatase [Paenibacillus selenitireducens]